jgi:hypothetical protein
VSSPAKKSSRVDTDEAMEEVRSILTGWHFHAGFPSESGLAALSVIKSALAEGREYERRWSELVETTARRITQAEDTK